MVLISIVVTVYLAKQREVQTRQFAGMAALRPLRQRAGELHSEERRLKADLDTAIYETQKGEAMHNEIHERLLVGLSLVVLKRLWIFIVDDYFT